MFHALIRCDGESEIFCKIFWKVNNALLATGQVASAAWGNKRAHRRIDDMGRRANVPTQRRH